MDSLSPRAYPAPVIARLLLLALYLLPLTARAHTTHTAPTTGDGDTDSDSASDGSETSTMPPEYEPCGCRADQLGGGWSLALAGLGLLALRRRRL